MKKEMEKIRKLDAELAFKSKVQRDLKNELLRKKQDLEDIDLKKL